MRGQVTNEAKVNSLAERDNAVRQEQGPDADEGGSGRLSSETSHSVPLIMRDDRHVASPQFQIAFHRSWRACQTRRLRKAPRTDAGNLVPLQTKRGRKSVNEAETGAKPSNGWMRLLFPSLWVMWYRLCSRVGSVVVRVKMELNGKGTRHENSRKRR